MGDGIHVVLADAVAEILGLVVYRLLGAQESLEGKEPRSRARRVPTHASRHLRKTVIEHLLSTGMIASVSSAITKFPRKLQGLTATYR